MTEGTGQAPNRQPKADHLFSFLFWTLATLVVCVAALIALNTYFNAAGNEIGNLGGAFQGTIGVAAALAGALVTIKLAVIAIEQSEKTQDLARQQNETAERQARNDDPDYQNARSAAALLQRVYVVRTLSAADKQRIENYNEKGAIGEWLSKLPPEAIDFAAQLLNPHMISFWTAGLASDDIFVYARHLDRALKDLQPAAPGDNGKAGSVVESSQAAIDAADQFLHLLVSIVLDKAAVTESGFWPDLRGQIPSDIKTKYGTPVGDAHGA